MKETSTDGGLADKAELRKRALAARAEAHRVADPVPALDAMAEEILHACPRGGVIAGYIAIRDELDPAPLLDRLAALGFRLCLPVVEAPAQPLAFRDWAPGDRLAKGVFGTRVPEEDRPAVPDLVIAPLVAFDATCARLGYGGGFYDRTLAKLRAGRGVTALGLAYAAQKLPALPEDATDEPLDAVVTEAGVYRPRRG